MSDKNLVEKIDLLMSQPLLDDWSRGFLESIKDQYVKRSSLSERQRTTFNKIQSRFSPQEVEKLKAWVETYNKDHKERAKVIAKYYSQTSYFSDIGHNILTKEDYVPDMHRYRKMSENKYAEGVWRNWSDEPKFADGEMVQFKSRQPIRNRDNRLAMVLNSKQFVRTHAKGGKAYMVLLFGKTNPVVCEERHLKKPNKNGRYL
tara:strand:- start:293 stop:901 length:609 start_codon:yes stop_codon:yes gene_type:complete